jgi:hypothetical protein
MGPAWSAGQRPAERTKMPIEIGQSRKNYIGIVSDKTEQQRAIESLAKSDHVLRDCFRGLMAAVLNRQSDAK